MTRSGLPVHPYTGLTALGFTKRGPIWPVRGGAADEPPADPPKPTDPPADPPKPTDPPATDDKPLGPGGEKALKAEREARQELERRLAALEPLSKIAQALGGGDAAKGKTEIEQLAERQAFLETNVAEERAGRWRAEVANEKGLTPAQAERLNGKTREELLSDADALLQLFPAGSAARTPAPDRGQGQGDGSGVDLDARIAVAMKAGDTAQVISLQNQKLRNSTT